MWKLKEVSLELTNLCNMACIHCSSEAGRRMKDELSLEEWLEVIDQAHELGAETISLSGGDPVVYPHWVEVVSRVVEHDMEVLFYTSSVRKTTKWLESNSLFAFEFLGEGEMRLLKELFGRSKRGGKLIFSLEGARPETHDRIMGAKGTFKKLTEEVIPTALRVGHTVELHFTPMLLNIEEVEEFLELAENLGVHRVSFLRLVPQGRAKKNAEMVSISAEDFDRLQRKLYEYSGEVKYRLGCPISFGHLYGYVSERPRCHAGEDLILVRPNGECHACAGWKESKELSIGNVRKDSLKHIWESSYVLGLIRKYNNEDAAAGECSSCFMKKHCGGGCPAQRIIFNQNLGVNDPWQKFTEGVDPMCPLWNGVVKPWNVVWNRLKRKFSGEMLVQDKEGNVLKEKVESDV